MLRRPRAAPTRCPRTTATASCSSSRASTSASRATARPIEAVWPQRREGRGVHRRACGSSGGPRSTGPGRRRSSSACCRSRSATRATPTSPVHSYWDDFWALRGLADAAELAAALGKTADAARFAASRDEMRAGRARVDPRRHRGARPRLTSRAPRTSATSTRPRRRSRSSPCGEGSRLPQTRARRTTFEDYWQRFVARRADRRAGGSEYTPYEWRIAGSLVRLGRRDRAEALFDFFLADRRPAAWNHWAEVVWPRPAHAEVHRRHAARLGRLGLHPLLPRSLRLRPGRGRRARPRRRHPGLLARRSARRLGLAAAHALRDCSTSRSRPRARGLRVQHRRRRRDAARRVRRDVAVSGSPVLRDRQRTARAGLRRRRSRRADVAGGRPREVRHAMSANRPLPANRYGHFSDDGTRVRRHRPAPAAPVGRTSSPTSAWASCVSHTGSGFSWIDNSQLADGDALAAGARRRTARASSSTSATPRTARSGRSRRLPCGPPCERFACRHGIGYTAFETAFHGIEARWTLFCDDEATVELWKVELHNASGPRRGGSSSPAFSSGAAASRPRRGASSAALPRDPARRRAERGLRAEPHVGRLLGALRALEHELPVRQRVRRERGRSTGMQGDKAAFLGRFGDLAAPASLRAAGRGRRSSAATRTRSRRCAARRPAGRRLAHPRVHARDGRRREEAAAGLVDRFRGADADGRVARARARGLARSASRRTAWRRPTPRSTRSTNDWVRYQAIAARLWGRAGYYQQSGAFGFRDQLQDSQVWLTIDPERCRRQLKLHAEHQFADGSVYHWWHPLTEQGHVTKMTDDLLWLAFVAASYLRETGDVSVLRRHARRTSTRQTPAPLVRPRRCAPSAASSSARARAGSRCIGAGDWNDGLSAMGLRGEAASRSGSASSSPGCSPTGPRSGSAPGARTSRASSATGAPRSSPRSTRTAGTASGTCAARSTTAARSGPRATAWAGSS